MPARGISWRSDAKAAWLAGVLSVVAITAAAAVFFLARHSAEQSAETAELSFDASAAARDNTAVAHASQPALTMAQSMLTEPTVLDLLRHSGANPSDPAVAIGEFRSHLELHQPSSNTLRILYHDSNPITAQRVANAVAAAIVDWHPAAANPPAAAQPLRENKPAPPTPAHASSRKRNDTLRAAYNAVADLEHQLSATNEKIEALTRTPASRPQATTATAPASAQSEQRRLLQAKLAADHQKLDELRVRYTDEYPDVENLKDEISGLQQQLAALPPEPARPNRENITQSTVNNDAEIAALRQKRARLTDQIAEKNDAIASLRLHPDAASAAQPTPAAAPPVPTIAQTTGWQNPFKIARLASLTARSWVWPTILASSLGILLCAASALFFLMPRHHLQGAPPAAITPPTAIAKESPEHFSRDLAWEGLLEAPAKEPITIPLTDSAQQPMYLEKTTQEVVEAEQIEAHSTEAHATLAANAASETQPTSIEESHSESRGSEPFTLAGLSLATFNAIPATDPHSKFTETQTEAALKQEELQSVSAEPTKSDSEWSALILEGLSQTSTLRMLERQMRVEKVNLSTRSSVSSSVDTK